MILDDPNYIRIAFSGDEQTSRRNPTPQQKAVYNFHEKRHSNEAEDIYTSTWFERTENFLDHVNPSTQTTFLKDWDAIRDLEFGTFFLAYPIPGYSLWQFLHACDELDAVICGNTQIESWLSLKPFQLMERYDIQTTWSHCLQHLRVCIEKRKLRGEALLQKLHSIFNGVEKLDSAYTSLEGTFSTHFEGKHLADQMMNTIRSAYEWRCHMIADLSVTDRVVQRLRSEDEMSNEEYSSSPMEFQPSKVFRSRSRPKTKGKRKRRRTTKVPKNGDTSEEVIQILSFTTFEWIFGISVILFLVYAFLWHTVRAQGNTSRIFNLGILRWAP